MLQYVLGGSIAVIICTYDAFKAWLAQAETTASWKNVYALIVTKTLTSDYTPSRHNLKANGDHYTASPRDRAMQELAARRYHSCRAMEMHVIIADGQIGFRET